MKGLDVNQLTDKIKDVAKKSTRDFIEKKIAPFKSEIQKSGGKVSIHPDAPSLEGQIIFSNVPEALQKQILAAFK